MTRTTGAKPINLQEGYQPKIATIDNRGDQPQLSAPLNPLHLKPPRGDTAIEPPRTQPPAQKN